MKLQICQEDFIRMFRLEHVGIPTIAMGLFAKYDLTYNQAGREDWEEYKRVFQELAEKKICVRSSQDNLLAFEQGWSENLGELRKSAPDDYEKALKPKYFRGSKFFRYNRNLVVSENYQIEYESFVIARLCLFHAYLRGVDHIYELGSGSCANLLLLSRTLHQTSLVGLDWAEASCQIATELGKRLSLSISGRHFDMLNPDYSLEIPRGSAIVSIHSFEQLGRSYEPILDYILRAKPSVVVQYEPVLDFYDDSTAFDSLALSYCIRRGYLKGYYSRLRQLEDSGQIRIVDAFRPGLGGVLHEQSVIVWEPA